MKGEAAALSVSAQHCQSHYFSTTPRNLKFHLTHEGTHANGHKLKDTHIHTQNNFKYLANFLFPVLALMRNTQGYFDTSHYCQKQGQTQL